MPHLTYLGPTLAEIWGVPKLISKVVKWPLTDPLWPNFAFPSLVPRVLNLHTKFNISSSNHSRDIKGVANFKSRSRDPFPTCKWGVVGDPIFGFLDPDLPDHYITFMGLRWRLRVVYRWASPLLRPFKQIFGPMFGWITWPMNRGRRWPHIWITWPQLAYSLYNFHWATMMIKGSLQVNIPIVKAFLTPNFVKPKIGEKFSLFGGKWSRNVKFCFRDPQKAHPCAKPRHLTYWSWKSMQGSWLSAPGRTKKLAESLDAPFRIFGGGRRGVIVSWWNFA